MILNLIVHSPLSILNYNGGGSKFTFVFSIMNQAINLAENAKFNKGGVILLTNANLLERLHTIQETYGYIPENEINNLAEQFELSRAKVYGTIKFYSMFYTEPTGKYMVRVCDSLSCHLNDSADIVTAVKNYLGIEDGETTEDKKFTLEVVECLGHCGEGPVMMVNDEIYTYLNENRAIQILKDCM